MSDQTILISLRRDELNDMIEKAVQKALVLDVKKETTEKKFIRGFNKLAEYLQCSKSTVQKLKDTGKIPYIQKTDRVILFDIEKVNEALSNKSFKRK